jgi:hypothetical protein
LGIDEGTRRAKRLAEDNPENSQRVEDDAGETLQGRSLKIVGTMNLRILLLVTTIFMNQQAKAPGLKETLAWMHNFAAENGSQQIGQSSIDNQACELGNPNCQVRRDESTFNSQGCAATITWSVSFDFRDFATRTYQVSLKDLDPNSVTLVKDRPFEIAVHADTTNSVKAITETLSQSKTGESVPKAIDKQTWVELVFDSKDDANRFAKAFKHAIQLCGGKPSTF